MSSTLRYYEYTHFADTTPTVFRSQQLATALQEHVAPRMIQANGYSFESVLFSGSLLAVCEHSVPLTGTYLRNLVKQIDS